MSPESTLQPHSFSENVAALAHLLAGEYGAAAQCFADGAPPAADFVRFIERNHLAWYLVNLVDTSGLRPAFAAHDLERIERATEARRVRQGLLIEELARLGSAFRQHGLDLILLKGPYLAQRFFGDARRRGFLDLDLLVRPVQLDAVEKLLAELGYRRLSTMLVSRQLTTRFTHGFDFARDDLRLDLHWSLGTHASYRIDYDRLWRAGDMFRLGRDEVRVLSEEDTLFFHLLSLFEDLDRGAARLRSFVDVHAMLVQLDARIDWVAFWEQRRVERTARVCKAVLGLFFALFNADERFPLAAGTVAAVTEQIRSRPRDETAALVGARERAFRNKLWAMRHYECPFWMSLAWWFLSLPFRLAVYHPGRWSVARWSKTRLGRDQPLSGRQGGGSAGV